MLFVLVGWVLFRAPDFPTAMSILASMAGGGEFGGTFAGSGLIIVSALVSVLVPSAHELKDGLLQPRPWLAALAASLAVYCVLEVGRGAPVSFIYFQF
jgi:hypothetical protein